MPTLIKRIVFVFCTLVSLSTYAQESALCFQDLQFIIKNIETQHPGFHINLTKENTARYTVLKDSLIEVSKANFTTKGDCQQILRKYLDFFKDKHLQIYDPARINEAGYNASFKSNNLPQYYELNHDTSYLKVPSFSYKLWKELDDFYLRISPLLEDKKYIILDIRNNGGGGKRMYKQLVKILRSHARHKNIAVIFNRKCASACEEVALLLSKNKHITTFGENTNGQFAYGYIKSYTTPGHELTFITTTKRYPKRLQYEYIGIAPQIKLSHLNESQWIQESLESLQKDISH